MLSVIIPTCRPVNALEGYPMLFNAIARRAMVTRSPDERSRSISLSTGESVISCASAVSLSVSPLIADTTTPTSCPSSRVRATLRATFFMRSILPTDVPPYFWTISILFMNQPVYKLSPILYKHTALCCIDLIITPARLCTFTAVIEDKRHRLRCMCPDADRRPVIAQYKHPEWPSILHPFKNSSDNLFIQIFNCLNLTGCIPIMSGFIRRLDMNINNILRLKLS